MQLSSHGPPGKSSAGGVGLIGTHRRERERPWSSTTLFLVACVTFLAGYFLGGGHSPSSPSSPSGGQSSEPHTTLVATTGTGRTEERAAKRLGGSSQGRLHAGMSVDGFKNATFEEIVAMSGALDDYPPLQEVGATVRLCALSECRSSPCTVARVNRRTHEFRSLILVEITDSSDHAPPTDSITHRRTTRW